MKSNQIWLDFNLNVVFIVVYFAQSLYELGFVNVRIRDRESVADIPYSALFQLFLYAIVQRLGIWLYVEFQYHFQRGIFLSLRSQSRNRVLRLASYRVIPVDAMVICQSRIRYRSMVVEIGPSNKQESFSFDRIERPRSAIDASRS